MNPRFGPYQSLVRRTRKIALETSVADLLAWDQETGMPPNALRYRAEQMAHLGGAAHRLFTAKAVGAWIAACEDHGFPPESDEAANVRMWRRQYDRQTRLPATLVERFQRVRTHAREEWRSARAKSDFRRFRPHLEKLVALSREKADRWGYGRSPYEALVEEYEPGLDLDHLESLFRDLQEGLRELLPLALERSARLPADPLEGDYPVEAQRAFIGEVAKTMGFDLAAGRIDTAVHPFCTGTGPEDCRLTTRYHPRDFTQSLFGLLHEAGHGLYEQGLLKEAYGTPVGMSASLGVHESQSRLWENHVGRSRAFWEYLHPIACRHFPALARLSADDVTAAVNRVRPSLIRVEADQVTYDLHIVLRFEIERRLIEGTLAVGDIPAWWNERFRQLLGLEVPRDAEGCLQDVHWSLGIFGYFPTYTLGNLNASQIMRRIRLDVPTLEADLAAGQCGALLEWLRDRIHRQGQRHLPHELITRATGEPTATACHLEFLRTRHTTSGA